jgi:3-dehydroquinate synthase
MKNPKMKKTLQLSISAKRKIETITYFVENSTQLEKKIKYKSPHCVLIYDERFEGDPFVKAMPNRWPVCSGEKIKSIEFFSSLIQKIHHKVENVSKHDLCFIALGGGTVGDLVGVIASVYKRGCPLIQIPTTWLAAIDSSHGGKNALNLQSKNQLGTIHYPAKVFIVKNLLKQQPAILMTSALGEMIKSAFLDQKLFARLRQFSLQDSDSLLRLLPDCIEIKNRFLKKDPFEENGQRFFLNLGHTVGHALEAQFKLPHGVAVLFGLEFMLRWSVQKKMVSRISAKHFLCENLKNELMSELSKQKFFYDRMIQNEEWTQRMAADKKTFSHGQVQEIFISKTRCKLMSVKLEAYESERKRQAQEGASGTLLF